MTFMESIEAAQDQRNISKRETFDRLVQLVWLSRNFTAEQHAGAVAEVPPDTFLDDLEACGRTLDELKTAVNAKGQ